MQSYLSFLFKSLAADRMEDLTSPELIRQNAKCDRTVSLYGFVRGIPFHENQNLHISGKFCQIFLLYSFVTKINIHLPTNF